MMKFDMSRAWNEATAMIGANREVMGIVAGIFFFLPSVAMTFIIPDPAQTMPVNPENMDAVGEMVLGLYAKYWWVILLAVLMQLVGYLALLALLRDERNPTVGAAIKTGVQALLPALAAQILFSIGFALVFVLIVAIAAATGLGALIGLAVVLGIVAMIYLSVKVSLTLPIMAIEKVLNPITAMVRSWKLTKGNSLRLFAFFLLIIVVYMVFSVVAGVAIMALAAAGETIGAVANALLSGVIGAAVAVIFVAVLASIHRQLADPASGSVSKTFE